MNTSQVIQSEKVATFVSKLKPTSISFSPLVLEKAEEILAQLDFPTTRTEAWKYTRVAKISNLQLETAIAKNSTVNTSENLVFTFENGNLITAPSTLPSGLQIKSIKACSAEEINAAGSLTKLDNEIFNCINTLYAQDGLYIHIATNTIVETPIAIVHTITDEKQIANVRNIVVAEKNSQAIVTISYPEAQGTTNFINLVNEVLVKENAKLSIDKLQNEAEGNFHIESDQIVQQANSNFTINTITLGGSFVRNNLNIDVAGNNCETHLNGAYVLAGTQHVDNHTCVDHKVAHCVSNELYKGVIGDKATAVFNGKVFVRKDAQKVNAFQSNGNILLSEEASANSKPELEIYADDVKCSHGSTIGQMDEQAIFYLRARGLSEKSAKQLMVAAFIEDALVNISSEKILEETHSILQTKFGWE